MNYFRIFIGACILVLAIYMVFPHVHEVRRESHKLKVVTSLFPLYDFVKNIGQDKVEVSLLLPPGVEAHAFEPKPSDMIKINQSDLFVYTGKFMEPWVADILSSVTNKNVRFVNTSHGIELMKLTEGMPDEAQGLDPHIWLNFNTSQRMVDSIAQALEDKDPSNAQFYQRRAFDYKKQLMQLDDQYRSGLTRCASKVIVYGGHYAFGYLAHRYGLEYRAAQGVIPDSEPTANDLVRLVDQVKKDKIRYVFYEEMTSPKIAETIAHETNAKILLLNAAHNVSKEEIEHNVSFLSIMTENLANLKIGLQCTRI